MFENMETLVSNILKENTKKFPKQPAIIYDNVTISNEELELNVLKVVSLLEKQNFPKHICIGLRFHHYLTYCIFSLALFKMKISQTTINPRESKDIQRTIIEEVDTNLIIQDIPLTNLLQKETFFFQPKFKFLKNTNEQLKRNEKLPKDASLIFLSSGTTGKKKLVSLSSSIYADQIKKSKTVFQGKAKEKFFCYSAVYYPYSKRSFILALLFKMTNIFTQKKPIDLISFCKENKINHLQLTPSQANNFLLKDYKKIDEGNLKLPHLKSCVLASSIITEPIREKILSTITKNLFIVYGTNEFGLISSANPDDIKKHKGTVGRLLSGISLKIINKEGKECENNEVGNIFVKSDKMINKYLNHKEATKKAYSANGYAPGDLGKLTEDGNLIFEGRDDDLMIFHGTNIYPREIESVLEEHPNVQESAVFPLKLIEQMDTPCAVVSVSTATSEKELIQWCNTKLGWRKPQKILFTKKLPRNLAGKVLKKELAKSVLETLQNSSSIKNFTDLLTYQAKKKPNGIAIIKEEQITYKRLENLTWQCATYLYKKGVKKGDILIHSIKDELLIAIAMLASARIGATSVSLKQGLPKQFLDETIKELKVSFIISDEKENKIDLPHIEVQKGFFNSISIDFSIYDKTPNFPWHIAIGSGSTGRQKLFNIFHKQEILNMHFSTSWLKCDENDNISSFTPLTYIGSKRRFLEALTAGVTYTILPQTNQLFKLLKYYKVTILHSSVFHIEKLLEQLPANSENHLSFLKMLCLESSTVSDKLRQRVHEKLTKKLYIRYGINETSTVSITKLDKVFTTKGTVGVPIDGLTVKIVDNKGKFLPPNEIGFICIKSQGMVNSYINDKDSTNKAFKNGWFFPGDLGKLTNDGQIIFLGRADNMMIMNGINIYPSQIENEMLKHPEVEDVIAFALKNKVSQDIPTCVLTLKNNAKVTKELLMKHALQRLSSYRPRQIIIVDKMPRDIEGKIKKDILTKLVIDYIEKENTL